MAGFGAGYALEAEGVPFVLYDRNPYYGGHTRSIRYPGGFVFDEGGHISFTKHSHVRDLLAENVGGRFEERRLKIDNYWHGYRVPHPVQCNLRGLPADLVGRVVEDFLSVRDKDPRTDGSYAEWLLDAYGKTFAETFPMVYGRKYHTTTMDRLTTEWIGPRMYRPSYEDVLRGVNGEQTAQAHYVSTFRYPSVGGFESYLASFAERFELRLNHRLTGLDPTGRMLRFENGCAEPYEKVISSVPLPELIPLIDGVPADVRDAASSLACTTTVLVNLGIARADLSDTAITYFYDEDVVFSRINLPHMFSPNNAPAGCGAIQAEVYFSAKYKPLLVDPRDLIGPVVRDLRRCGFIRDADFIVLRDAAVVRYANVIFDRDRRRALETVHGFLDDVGVYWCGRYGSWNQAWTDEAFIEGEQAARTALGAA